MATTLSATCMISAVTEREAEPDRFAAARQAWLDALPVSAAIVEQRSSGTVIVGRNDGFARLDRPRRTGRHDTLLDRAGATAMVHAVLCGDSTGERFEWRDGGLVGGRYFSVAISPLVVVFDTGPRALVTLIDRTSEIETGESLRRQMLSDPLTGLANRAGFVEGLELKLGDDGPERYAVLIVDLARFSRVNECMGSLGGDELIITVARRLATMLRGTDLLARTGANEFAIAARMDGDWDGKGGGAADDVTAIARRVEAALGQPFRLSDFEINIDCAVGCAVAREQTGDAETLIRHAQLALKLSKGSKRTEVYRPAALNAARRRFVIETELRRAIERDELTLGYQPLVDLATGRLAGFEALARWHHRDEGEIGPNEFIAVAEDSGLIVPLGRWALDCALSTLKSWDDAAGHVLPLYVGVNLSPVQVMRDDVAAPIAAALAQHGIAGSRLSVELTESTIIGDPARATRMLDALKASDVLIAMDDFGTGFSSLASLQRLPIDTLKIDRSFITDMLDDPDRIAVVRAILGLAQALGMTTTAEGVETAELARTLAALGCTTAQGYYYAAALAPADAYARALGSLAITPR